MFALPGGKDQKGCMLEDGFYAGVFKLALDTPFEPANHESKVARILMRSTGSPEQALNSSHK